MLNGVSAQLKVTLEMVLVVQKLTPPRYMYLLSSRQEPNMAAGAIANFDSFVWIALGLFIVGLIGVMVYERSSSKAKRQQPQRQPSHAGTNTDIE
jgi:hypothetical protein